MNRPTQSTFHALATALLILCIGIATGCATKAPPRAGSTSFYVAPNGDDMANGTQAAPFATIQKALSEARQTRSHQSAAEPAPCTIFVRGGTYALSNPLEITAADSGTMISPLLITAYANEKPILSGGRAINHWKESQFNGQSCWVADLPEVRAGKWYFQELWVNGRRAQRARHPNDGYLNIASLPDKAQAWNKGQTRFTFAPGDVQACDLPSDANAVVLTKWAEGRMPLTSIDESTRTISTTKRSAFAMEPNDLFFLEGSPQWLDRAGEWYLDRTAGKLYYLPLPDQTPDSVQVVAPVLSELLKIQGSPTTGNFVEFVTLRGLTFSHTEWLMPQSTKPTTQPARGGFGQAASPVPGALLVNDARRCAIERCTFEHVGGYGIELTRGCQHDSISECEFADLGAGGVKIGPPKLNGDSWDRTFANTVTDCLIYDGGKFYPSAVGIWLGQTDDNLIAHNLIHDFFYTAISVGWTWGYKPTLAKNNIIEFNHIHHIGQLSNGQGPILSDMGAIYTLGIQPGTILRSNLCHDIAGLKYGGWGIYLDEGSSNILVENNVIYRTTHGGFHQHYGQDNLIRNNIFAFGRDMQLQRTRHEDHSSFTFERNIIYWPAGNLAVLHGGNIDFINNLFWQTQSRDIEVDKMPFANWEQTVRTQGSVVADPKFVDPQNGNFHLRSGSAAESIGFVPMDLSGAGPRATATVADTQ